MGTLHPDPKSLYDVLGSDIIGQEEDPNRPPDTTYTATVETIDNDRLDTLLGGTPAI